jgi:CCR4-NOT transcription complex subunit 4
MRKEFFGQYGKIKRLVVNNSKAYNPEGMNGPSFSAYVSFSTNQECSLALLSIDNTNYDGHTLKASFGSTKYCLHYLRNIECINKECLFLHSMADDKDIINKVRRIFKIRKKQIIRTFSSKTSIWL